MENGIDTIVHVYIKIHHVHTYIHVCMYMYYRLQVTVHIV
jgi:hypothetical protein